MTILGIFAHFLDRATYSFLFGCSPCSWVFHVFVLSTTSFGNRFRLQSLPLLIFSIDRFYVHTVVDPHLLFLLNPSRLNSRFSFFFNSSAYLSSCIVQLSHLILEIRTCQISVKFYRAITSSLMPAGSYCAVLVVFLGNFSP